MNLFEYIYPRFYFSKGEKVRLFEAFSGVGCQAMALKRITDNYELVGFSEIDKYAIQSYRAIHGEVKNYGDITKMENIPECDIFTWSFPCTDLSKAGKQKGLDGTRSGLVYEVLRLLRDTAEYCPFHRHIPKNSKIHSMGKSTDYYQPIPNRKKLPKVLIMENVVDLVQIKFVKQFNEIQLELEQLGYKNYNEILNAKDFGIPQNRERIFMVSILGDYSYTFPEPIKLELRLKDFLENEVDEKYYLSEKMIKQISSWNAQVKPLKEAKTKDDIIIQTITAKSNTSMNSSMLLIKEPTLKQVAQLDGYESSGRIYDEDGLCPTINTMQGGGLEPKVAIKTWNNETKAYKTKEVDMPRDRIYTDESIGFTITTNESQMPMIAIKEATTKGYAEASDGDGVYLNRPEQKRGVVQKGMIQTLKTSGNDVGVVVQQKARGYNKGGQHELCPPITANSFQENNHLLSGLRIRKLTPLECWRLMAISDTDFDKAQESGMSNAQLYKQAGNGIVVNVFEAILRNLFKE